MEPILLKDILIIHQWICFLIFIINGLTWYNIFLSPLLTQPPYQFLTPVHAPDAPDSPLLGPYQEAINTDRLASEVDLDGDCLMSPNNNFPGVYQDWIHQNSGTHLDGGIDENGKWQEIEKADLHAHPMLWITVWIDQE